jgi:hypothetical protein
MGVFGLLLPLLALAGEPSLPPLPIAGLEREYAVNGVITAAYRTDAGKQQRTLILSRTGSFSVDDHEARSARLYATLFVDGADGAQQAWLIQDLVDTCPVDIDAEFTTPPASISDADADGEPEFWVSYRVACRGDVSPATLKLIGYEGTQKYALRGTTRLAFDGGSDGGEFEPDPAFKGAPKLLEHARGLWLGVRDEHF